MHKINTEKYKFDIKIYVHKFDTKINVNKFDIKIVYADQQISACIINNMTTCDANSSKT